MRRFFPFILAALLLIFLPAVVGAAPQATDANADQAQATGIYVVRRGDTLSSIASRHCMTTTELFNLNSSILTNPNQIYVGMQLRVINRCGGGGGSGGGNWGVCDRGPSQHAQGSVSGNRYFVARGDTSFSIATRFGINVTTLCQANGIDPWRIFAGQTLVIPGLSGSCGGSCGSGNWNCPPNNCWNCPPTNCSPGWNCPVTPDPRPTVVPITPVPPVVSPRIWVDRPRAGETLPATFTVSGRGQGLFEGNVVVTAQTLAGGFLAQQSTILQGTNVGAGGAGTFSVQLTVSVATPTPGWVIVSSPQSPVASVPVQVTFSPSGAGQVSFVTYPANTCGVNVGAGQPFFGAVGGPPIGTFSAANGFFATRGARTAMGQLWYEVGPIPSTLSYVWAPSTSTTGVSAGCNW